MAKKIRRATRRATRRIRTRARRSVGRRRRPAARPENLRCNIRFARKCANFSGVGLGGDGTEVLRSGASTPERRGRQADDDGGRRRSSAAPNPGRCGRREPSPEAEKKPAALGGRSSNGAWTRLSGLRPPAVRRSRPATAIRPAGRRRRAARRTTSPRRRRLR